jgi:formate hydrogenlyase subunit 3/multisubunit Na+/H+ antiporter MnhD subunit
VVIGRLMRAGLVISAILTVILGLLPELLLPVVERAAKALTQ